MFANFEIYVYLRIHSFNINFQYMVISKHTHKSCNAVPLVWGLLRLVPITAGSGLGFSCGVRALDRNGDTVPVFSHVTKYLVLLESHFRRYIVSFPGSFFWPCTIVLNT